MLSNADVSPPEKPYVGPVPFERKDQPLFFGRDYESDELLSLITAHPVVMLYSQSGAGKTSLVNAGLIPLLEKAEFRIIGPARVKGEIPAGFNYEHNPYIFNVVTSLANIYSQISTSNTRTIVDCITKAAETKNGQLVQPTVLILDQFEELFTHNPELWKYRRGFFEDVGKALKDTSLRVVFAMREDFIAEMDPYEALLPEKLRTRFRLERLRKPAALDAITGPLTVEPWKEFQREFAPGDKRNPGVAEQLVDTLCEIPAKVDGDGNAAMSEFVEPLQLQLVCQAIWEKLGDDERFITAQHIEQFGDVNAVLTAFYEGCLKSAVEKSNQLRPANEPELREPALRGWFDRELITETGKRSMVFRGAHDTEGIPNRAVDELEMRHLIRAELRDGERWYELSHDRFLQPIKESYKRWLLEQPGAEQTRIRLEERARQWFEKRNDALLLDAGETLEARRWLNSPESEGLTYTERLVAYVKASEAAEQERVALRRKQRVRQMKYGIAGMALLLLIAIIAGASAVTQRVAAVSAKEEAQRQRDLALTAESAARKAAAEAKAAEERATASSEEAKKERDAAEAAEKVAQAQTRLAELAKAEQARLAGEARNQASIAQKAEANEKVQRTSAETQRTLAESRVVASVAANALSQPFFDPEVGALLGLEAVNRAPTTQALDVLRDSLALLSHNRNKFAGGTKPLTGVSFSPDGTHLVTTDDHSMSLWNLGLKAAPPDSVHNWPEGTLEGSVVSPTNGLIVVLRKTNTSTTFDPGLNSEVQLFARLLDVLDSNGNLITTLQGGNSEAQTARIDPPTTKEILTFSDDQKTLILAGRNDIRAWDVGTWNMKPGFPINFSTSVSRNYYSSSLNLNGKYAVLPSIDSTSGLYLIDLTSPPKIKNLNSENTGKVTFSNDGKLVAVASTAGIRIFETTKVFETPILDPVRLESRGVVSKMAFSHKRDLLVVVNNNTATIRSLDANVSKEPVELTGHTGPIVSVMFDPKDEFVLTGSEDGTARIWDVATGASLAELRGHTRAITDALFSPDGSMIITASADGTARLWVTNGEPSTFTLKAQQAVFSPGGNYIATFDRGEHDFSLWEAGTGRKLWSKKCHDMWLTREVFSSDDKLLALACHANAIESGASKSGFIDAVNSATGESVATTQQQKDAVVYFSESDNDHVLISDEDGIGRWNLESNKVKRYPNADGSIASMSRDGQLIVSGARTGATVHIWNLEGKPGLNSPKVRQDSPDYAIFSPDSKFVLSLDLNSIDLWRVGSNETIPLPFNENGPTELYALNLSAGAFSPDGKYIVVPAPQNTAQVVKLDDGSVTATLAKHTGTVLSASFSPDGRFIVTASADGTARVWAADKASDKWESIAVLRGHKNEVQTATFSPDSRFVLTSSSDGTCRVYSSEAFGLKEELRELAMRRILRLPQELTSEERKRYLGELGLEEAPKPTPAPKATPIP